MADALKKLLWVLGISLALHLALLLGPHLSLPSSLHPAEVLEARLEIPPPARPAPRKAASPAQPRKAQPQRAAVKATQPPAAAPDTAAVAAPQAEPAPVQAEPAPEAPPADEAPTMPQQATIRYTVYKGLNGLRVGRAEQVWKRDGNHYAISSIAEASGLFSLFASGKHIQRSQGEITASGLRPASYRVERGQGADKTDTARFDWDAMTLTLASGGDRQTQKLQDGTQDLLSFMYQLAFAPPQHSAVQLTVTNGRKLDSYAYWVVEEALETPMGRLNTLHLGKQREEGDKDTEVWLAADYHYLPVKISQIDKDGDGLVLLANEIELKP